MKKPTDDLLIASVTFIFKKLGFTPFKPLQGIELQEKEAQKY